MHTSQQCRIMGLDVGDRRIGWAITDPLAMFAQPLTTIAHGKTGQEDPIKQIIALLQQHGPIYTLVVGLPKKMDGTEGDQAAKVRALVARLQTHVQSVFPGQGLDIAWIDERFTSVVAHQTMQAQGVAPSRNKALVDQVAAVQILQALFGGPALARLRRPKLY